MENETLHALGYTKVNDIHADGFALQCGFKPEAVNVFRHEGEATYALTFTGFGNGRVLIMNNSGQRLADFDAYALQALIGIDNA